MNKPYWNILIFILINFGYSQKITDEKNETFFASGNLTSMKYEIIHFNDTNTEVSNNLES